jgi:hypothetical protein
LCGGRAEHRIVIWTGACNARGTSIRAEAYRDLVATEDDLSFRII